MSLHVIYSFRNTMIFPSLPGLSYFSFTSWQRHTFSLLYNHKLDPQLYKEPDKWKAVSTSHLMGTVGECGQQLIPGSPRGWKEGTCPAWHPSGALHIGLLHFSVLIAAP